MLAMRKGGTCKPSFSLAFRFFVAFAAARANLPMNTDSRGLLKVALAASLTTRSTPADIYSCRSKSLFIVFIFSRFSRTARTGDPRNVIVLVTDNSVNEFFEVSWYYSIDGFGYISGFD